MARETRTLVVDIGGGTSDFTVIRLGPERAGRADRSADILATTGVHIGGTDFDRLLDLDVVMPHLGYRHIGRARRPLPSSLFFDLSTWHLIHQTTSRQALHFARGLRLDYVDTALHDRLMQVLERQYGHRLLAEVEAGKIACSQSGQPAGLDLSCLPGSVTGCIDDAQMQHSLHSSLAAVVACAQDCVRLAGLQAVDTVYLTGGSSALRPLMAALQQAMPAAQLVQGNLFGGVAAGLAHAGAVSTMAT